MRLQTLRHQFISSINAVYPKTEAERFFTFLAEDYLNMSRVEVVLQADTEVSNALCSKFQDAEKRLLQFEPIQYILGYTEFCDLKFKVNSSVLIPRPETEELVYWIIEESQQDNLSVVDLCTGSGCIAISLQKHLNNATVDAVDVSKEALEIAAYNSEKLNATVNFKLDNVLENIQSTKRYDIIVSNPPYVRHSEKPMMQPNVLKYEPDLALFVETKKPLVFYEHIAKFAQQHLAHNGYVYLEINEYLSLETKQLFLANDFKDVQLKTDIFGKPRFIKARR